MYTCQGILHPGAPSGGCLIHSADCLLSLAGCYWLDRKVEVVKNQDQWKVKYEGGGCGFGDPCCPRRIPGELFSIGKGWQRDHRARYSEELSFFSPFIQIPVALLSLPGVIFKSLIYCADEEAASYSKLTESYLLLEELQARKEILQKKKEETRISITCLQQNLKNSHKSTPVNLEIKSGEYPDECEDASEIMFEIPNDEKLSLNSSKEFFKAKSFDEERIDALTSYLNSIQKELEPLEIEILDVQKLIHEKQESYAGI